MKKIYFTLLVLTLILIPRHSAQAYFWSNWFKKAAPATTQPSAAVTAAQAAIDAKLTQQKAETIQQILTGEYRGSSDVNLSFSEAEVNNVLIPLAKTYLQKFMDKQAAGNTAEISQITLGDGTLEIIGKAAGGKISSGFSAQLSLASQSGQVKVGLNRIKMGWIVLPQFAIDRAMKAFKIKPENLMFNLPNLKLTEFKVSTGQISLIGKYSKGN